MSINFTETAIQELQRVKSEGSLGGNVVVRVGITGGGCSGFMYDMDFDDAENITEGEDIVNEVAEGLRVVVDKKSDIFLDGTTVDWHEDLQKRGFVFDNPQAVKKCGCGSSFTC